MEHTRRSLLCSVAAIAAVPLSPFADLGAGTVGAERVGRMVRLTFKGKPFYVASNLGEDGLSVSLPIEG